MNHETKNRKKSLYFLLKLILFCIIVALPFINVLYSRVWLRAVIIYTVALIVWLSLLYLIRLKQHNANEIREQVESVNDLLKLAYDKCMDARSANKAKSNFLARMSHEIRTPMNAVTGMTEVLLRGEHSPEDTQHLMNIKRSGEALVTIINDILDLSKIESGKMEIIEDEYEPTPIMCNIGEMFLNRIGGKNIELVFDIDKNLPRKLYGDSLRIHQVIINLMNNATKFTEQGAVCLSIRVSKKEGDTVYIRYCVSDTGQGIKDEDKDKLFGEFAQVDVKKNYGKEGSGLGLNIARQLVGMMGGEIAFDSEYGKGSEFYFTIPQKIIEDLPVAEIYAENAKVSVSCRWTNSYAAEHFKSLTAEFGIVNSGEEIKEDTAFYFTDDSDFLIENKDMLDGYENLTVCLVHNPLRSVFHLDGVIKVDKPLSCISFCRVLNGEENFVQVNTDGYIDFAAPSASVLLVDDNQMNQVVAVSLLEPLQMQIDLADNGKDAINKLEQKHYDLVFMDHMMPVMDGIEATKLIRSMHAEYFCNVPIIALTANAVKDAIQMFKDAGMDDFISKPIVMADICKKIKKWLPDDLIVEREPDGFSGDNTVDLSDIPDIPGIDKEAGVTNSGSKELFIKLLSDYQRIIDIKINKIRQCLNDNLIRDYTIEVHGLKGTSRIIGALELSKRFEALEEYGNAENLAKIAEETDAVLAEYEKFKAYLSVFRKEERKKTADVSEIISIITGIKEAADEFDIDRVDALAKELEAVSLPTECTEKTDLLLGLIADVALDDIANTAEEILQMLDGGK